MHHSGQRRKGTLLCYSNKIPSNCRPSLRKSLRKRHRRFGKCQESQKSLEKDSVKIVSKVALYLPAK